MRYVTGSSLEQALYAAKAAKSTVGNDRLLDCIAGSSALRRGGSARVLTANSSSSVAAVGNASQPQLRSVFEGATDIFKGASGLLADVESKLDHNRNRFSELFAAQTKSHRASRRTDKAVQKSDK